MGYKILIINIVLYFLTILPINAQNIFDLTSPERNNYEDFYNIPDDYIKPTLDSGVSLERDKQSSTSQGQSNIYQGQENQVNSDYINTIDATKIDPGIDFKEYIENMSESLSNTNSQAMINAGEKTQNLIEKTHNTAQQLAKRYCETVSDIGASGGNGRQTVFQVNSQGKPGIDEMSLQQQLGGQMGLPMDGGLPTGNTPLTMNSPLAMNSAAGDVAQIANDFTDQLQDIQSMLDETAGQMGQAFTDFWHGFAKEKENVKLKGRGGWNGLFNVMQNVNKTNEYLSGLNANDMKKSSKQQLIADSYAMCLAEMGPYYEGLIYKLALQNLKMNTLYRQGQRELYEIQNKQADLDLTRSIQRHIANVDENTIDPSELVISDKKEVKNIEEEMKKRADRAKNSYVAFLDGTIVYGDGTKKIAGKRATIPTDEHNIELIKRAFFYNLADSYDRYGNKLTGFEGVIFSSSGDPLLSLLFAVTLADIVELYNIDPESIDRVSVPGFIINHVCALNYIVSTELQKALTRYGQISKPSENLTQEDIGKMAENILETMLSNIRNEFINEFTKISNKTNSRVNNLNINKYFDLNNLVNMVIVPGYNKLGAYSDIVSLANAYDKNENLKLNKNQKYALSYLISAGTQSGYFNNSMGMFRDYLNRDYGNRLRDSINRYLVQLKQYELNMINEPVFESVNTSIIHVNQMNAIENVQLQIDKEYKGYENLTKLRCLF